MTEQEKLELSIRTLEQQRELLGPEAVDPALEGLRRQLAALQSGDATSQEQQAMDLAGERKLVTVVFADISGFTALSADMDPEQVRDMINSCFSALVPIVEKYGGFVDKFVGDMIMALFGAPVTHENDPERALRASLEMMQSLSAFNERNSTRLEMHIGINSGLVVAGGLGSEGRQHYSVMGDTVNLASRLEDASEPGQILVGPATYQMTSSVFEFESLQPIRVKGKMDLIRIFRLVGLRSQFLQEYPLRSHFVGREAELKVLRTSLQELQSGEGSVIAVKGEPGIGKSRLVAEFRQIALAGSSRIRWAEGNTQSFVTGLSYWIACNILDGLCGIPPGTSGAEAGDLLRNKAKELLCERYSSMYPYLARLRNIQLTADEEELIKNVLPSALQERMHGAFFELTEAACKDRPLILVWEDLHWADPSSLSLLESILPLVHKVPVIFLLTFRSNEEVMDNWFRNLTVSGVTRQKILLDLSPLTVDESSQMMRNIIRNGDIPEKLRQLVLTRAEGNPFFLEELVESILEDGQTGYDRNNARSQYKENEPELPDTLQGVVAARIDRLIPDEKQTLQSASVLGRNFRPKVLSRLFEREKNRIDLEKVLTTLTQKDLVRKLSDSEYSFTNAITREVAYNSLLITRRRHLHREAAVVIESLYPNRTQSLSAILAHHYERAGEVESSIRYNLLAALRAQRTWSNTEAIGFYQAALKQTTQVPSTGEYEEKFQELIARIHEGLGDVHTLTGEHDAARLSYEEAIMHVPNNDIVWKARLCRRIGTTWKAERKAEEAIMSYEKARLMLGEIKEDDDPRRQEESLEIDLHLLEAYYFSLGSVPRMLKLAAEIAPSVSKWGTAAQRAKYYTNLCMTSMLHHRYSIPDETLEFAEKALSFARKTNDKRLVTQMTFGLGFAHIWRGNFTEAEAGLQEALELARQTGDREQMVTTISWLTVLYRRTDNPDMVRNCAREGAGIAAAANIAIYLAISKATTAWLSWHEGDWRKTKDECQAALTIFQVYGSRFFGMWLMYSLLMEMAFRQGDHAEAIRCAKEILGPGQMRIDHTIEDLLHEAIHHWEEGKETEAQPLLEKGIDLMKRTGWM